MKTRKTVPMNPTEGQEWSRRQESGPVAAAGRRGRDEWRRGTHAGTWPQRRQRWPKTQNFSLYSHLWSCGRVTGAPQ